MISETGDLRQESRTDGFGLAPPVISHICSNLPRKIWKSGFSYETEVPATLSSRQSRQQWAKGREGLPLRPSLGCPTLHNPTRPCAESQTESQLHVMVPRPCFFPLSEEVATKTDQEDHDLQFFTGNTFLYRSEFNPHQLNNTMYHPRSICQIPFKTHNL